ncbi:hypothetical protein [Melittangium boletus]|nr:hypothetical protein [Melittangium boletus]
MKALLFGILVVIAVGCGAPQNVVQEQLESFAAEQEGKERLLDLRETEPAKGLIIRCPLGVLCDEHSDYRRYAYDTQGIYLAFSFDAAVVTDMTLESLREKSRFVSYELKEVEGLRAAGWRIGTRSVVHRAGDADYQVQFTELRDGRLRGEIHTAIVALTGLRTGDSACTHPLQDASLPEDCAASASANIPLRILFDLPIQTGVLDCRGERKPGCG